MQSIETTRKINLIMSRDEIAGATREELVFLLEQSFCIQCYDHESMDVLREAAYENWDTEYGDK